MTNYNKEPHSASIEDRSLTILEKYISIANALAYAAKHDTKNRSKKETDFLISHFLEIMEVVDQAKSMNRVSSITERAPLTDIELLTNAESEVA